MMGSSQDMVDKKEDKQLQEEEERLADERGARAVANECARAMRMTVARAEGAGHRQPDRQYHCSTRQAGSYYSE